MENISLSIENKVKNVPYKKETRNGSINNGFINLRDNPNNIKKITEVLDNPPLKNTIIKLNSNKSKFFTIGCEKRLNHNANQFCYKGYIELAFNDTELVEDIYNYFNLFYLFNDYIYHKKEDLFIKDNIKFHWEISTINFKEIKARGYSITPWITTQWYNNKKQREKSWEKSLKIISDFILEESKHIKNISIY